MSLSEKYPHKVSSDTMSVASRTTSDYFPRSYKRPAPYLLWDDNIVPIHITSTSSASSSSSSSSDFTLCRLLLTILITVAAIGVVVIVAAAVYLGVLTSDLMDEVTNEQSFDGRLRITDGDRFVPELANSSSLEFQLKAKRYETMLNVLLKESPLKEGFKETEVIGFRTGSLMVFFRVHLDRRKVQLKSTHDMAVAIHTVIVEDASKKIPRALKDITIDMESISVWDLLYKKTVPAFKVSTRRSTPPPTAQSTQFKRTFQENSPDSKRTMPTTPTEDVELVTSTGVSETSDNEASTTISFTTTDSEVIDDETTTASTEEPASRPVENQTDVLYGPWTPIVPAVHETKVSFDVLKTISNTEPSAPVIPTSSALPTRFSSWRPLYRPEALTSGVASEIPFSLGDFLAYEAGFRNQASKSASRQFSTDVRPETPISNFPMETNVGAVLLLRNSPRNESVFFSSPGQGGTSPLRPIAAALPPWRWRDRVTPSSSDLTTRRKLRQRPSLITMTSRTSTVRSIPPLGIGAGFDDGLRVTSSDASLRIVTSSRTPAANRFDAGVETVIQSTNFLVKSPKKLNSDPAENLHVPMTTQGWIPVAASNWRTTIDSVVKSTTESSSSTKLTPRDEVQTVHSTSTVIHQSIKPIIPATLERDIETLFQSSDISLKDVASSEVNVCPKPGNFRCRSGGCVSHTSRCNQMRDCSDNSDEDGCSCADYLYAQLLSEKICDGVVDCWDYSDENRCSQCSPEMFVCPNSNVCVKHDRICDAVVDCPGGEDEKQCVRVAANESLASDGHYHRSGYLMVRKNGKWGHLCVENFSRFGLRASSSTLGLTQLASAVCQTLTFSDYVSVERKKVPPMPQTYDHRGDSFYRLALQPSDAISRNILEFNQTSCRSRDVIWMQCKNLECGVRPMAPSPTARIVGGSNALAGSWPWQVAMYKSGEYMCGATLINDRWLLSAAHCFYNEIDNYWTARLGMLRRGSQAPHEQIHVVSHIVIHPHYVKVGFVNDVALLRLQNPATFSDFVRPVCLPSVDDESVIEGRMCTVVGWGQLLESGHVFPDTLQEVELPIFTSQECRKKTVFLQTYQITENMFCAGYDRGGRDACLGDSGGPLVCQQKSSNKWSLVGITSNGFGCARAWRPGIYTKVANYVSWLNQVMDSPLRTPIRSHCRGHRCRLGKCLLAISVCNGYVECADGSDERGCPA